MNLLVEDGVVVRAQRAPVFDGGVPGLALRSEGAALQIGERRLVRCDHAHLGAHLDGHVGERHASFHRERLDARAREFDRVARATRGRDPCGDREDQVLGIDAFRENAVTDDAHRLEALLLEGLGRHHVLDLGRADAERECPEGAVRGRVAVAAHERSARQREARLRTHDVHDALAGMAQAEERHAELAAVADQGRHLLARLRTADVKRRLLRRDVVVHRREHQVGTA